MTLHQKDPNGSSDGARQILREECLKIKEKQMRSLCDVTVFSTSEKE